MKTKAGLGLQGSNLDLEDAVSLGVKDFLLLEPEGIEGGDLQRLIEMVPDVRIALRLYHPDRMGELGPYRAAADRHRIIASTTPEQRQHIVAVIPANELNLDSEHDWVPYAGFWKTREGYGRINQWLYQWAQEWHIVNLTNDWQPQLWWPALAPGHNPSGQPPESEYDLLSNSLKAYDAIGIHVYGPIADDWAGSGRLARIVDKLELLGFGDKPRHVTEVNQVNFAMFLAYAGQCGIKDGFWFLWRSAGEDHRQWDLKEPWIDGLKEYIAETEVKGMPSQSLRDQFSLQYGEWITAGGDPDAGFKAHLMALGVLPVTQQDFSDLCERAKSLAEQIKLVGFRIPKV